MKESCTKQEGKFNVFDSGAVGSWKDKIVRSTVRSYVVAKGLQNV